MLLTLCLQILCKEGWHRSKISRLCFLAKKGPFQVLFSAQLRNCPEGKTGRGCASLKKVVCAAAHRFPTLQRKKLSLQNSISKKSHVVDMLLLFFLGWRCRAFSAKCSRWNQTTEWLQLKGRRCNEMLMSYWVPGVLFHHNHILDVGPTTIRDPPLMFGPWFPPIPFIYFLLFFCFLFLFITFAGCPSRHKVTLLYAKFLTGFIEKMRLEPGWQGEDRQASSWRCFPTSKAILQPWDLFIQQHLYGCPDDAWWFHRAYYTIKIL